MNKQEYIAQSVAAIESACERCERVRDAAVATLEAYTGPDASDEFKRLQDDVKSAIARKRENAALLPFFNSEPITALLYAHRIDFEKLTTETGADSRECKKRLAIVLRALSVNNVDSLGNAEYRYFAALATGKLSDSHSLASAQSVMQHQTTTQARYMRSFLLFFKASKASDTQTICVERDSATMRKILALFA